MKKVLLYVMRIVLAASDSQIVFPMSLAQVVGHGNFVVEFGKGRVGVISSNVKNFLRGRFNSLFLLISRLNPDKIVVDDII